MSAATPPAADCPFEQPDLRPISDRHYRLYQEYRYCWDTAGDRNRIRIPDGFTTDGVSVPRVVWTLSGITPDGMIRAAALVHDFIYAHTGLLPVGTHEFEVAGSWKPVTGRWARSDADRLFARIMREAQVPKLRRRLAYLAVRVFGGGAWR